MTDIDDAGRAQESINNQGEYESTHQPGDVTIACKSSAENVTVRLTPAPFGTVTILNAVGNIVHKFYADTLGRPEQPDDLTIDEIAIIISECIHIDEDDYRTRIAAARIKELSKPTKRESVGDSVAELLLGRAYKAIVVLMVSALKEADEEDLKYGQKVLDDIIAYDNQIEVQEKS